MIFLIWLLFIAADALWNYIKIKKDLTIFHGFEALYRCVAFGLLYGLAKIYELNTLQNVSFALGCFFSGWMTFNIELNGFRKLPIGHLGNNILDKLEAMCPSPAATMFWKLVFAGGSISAFYYGTLNPVG